MDAVASSVTIANGLPNGLLGIILSSLLDAAVRRGPSVSRQGITPPAANPGCPLGIPSAENKNGFRRREGKR